MPKSKLLPEQIKWLQHPAFGVAPAAPGGNGRPGGPPATQAPAAMQSLHMRFSISASVGRGGKNKTEDVQAVQVALNSVANAGLTVSGKMDDKTIAAITAFQASLGGFKPDGLVEPGRRTAKALAAPAKTASPASLPADAPTRKPAPNLSLPADYADRAPPPKDTTEKSASGNADSEADVKPSAEGEKGRQALAEDIAKQLKSKGDLVPDFQTLSGLDMPDLLDVIQRLEKAGALDGFGEYTWKIKSGSPVWQRVAIAILTVKTNWDEEWQELFATLNEKDQNAIMHCVPAELKDEILKKRKKNGGVEVTPAEPTVDTSGVGTSSTDGPDMQAKLTFHSKSKGKLGETEFTVHVLPDGKLKQLELDLTAVKIGLETLDLDNSVVDLDITLSLNATADNKTVKVDPQSTRVIFEAVQLQAKAEIEAHFKSKKVPWLKKLAFKLTANWGTAGGSLSGSVEIPIPWGGG